MTYLDRAIKDGYAIITGPENKQKIISELGGEIFRIHITEKSKDGNSQCHIQVSFKYLKISLKKL